MHRIAFEALPVHNMPAGRQIDRESEPAFIGACVGARDPERAQYDYQEAFFHFLFPL